MADIINSVDRSLDMYIYDLYIYRYISLSIYRSIFLYLFWLADIFASVERWAQRCGAGGCRREATWICHIQCRIQHCQPKWDCWMARKIDPFKGKTSGIPPVYFAGFQPPSKSPVHTSSRSRGSLASNGRARRTHVSSCQNLKWWAGKIQFSDTALFLHQISLTFFNHLSPLKFERMWHSSKVTICHYLSLPVTVGHYLIPKTVSPSPEAFRGHGTHSIQWQIGFCLHGRGQR